MRTGRLGRFGVARSAVTGLVVMGTLALAGVAGGATGGIVALQVRPGRRGPLPLRLPGHGRIDREGGPGHHDRRLQVQAGHAPVPLALRRAVHRQVDRQQRRRHLERRDLQRNRAGPARVPHHRQQPAGRGPGGGGRGGPAPGDRAGRAGLPELLQQGLRPVRPQGRDRADERDREHHRGGAEPGPGPGLRRRRDHHPAAPRVRRDRNRHQLPGGRERPVLAVRGPGPCGRVRRATPTSTRRPSRRRTPTSGRGTQNCTTISDTEAEVVGTMLANKKAIYAGEADLQAKDRKFGTYVPDVPSYLSCTSNALKLLTTKYHLPSADFTKFAYGLDISTFQQSAQQAIVQFKAEGVTTVILACDPFSAGLLTMAAAAAELPPRVVHDRHRAHRPGPVPTDLRQRQGGHRPPVRDERALPLQRAHRPHLARRQALLEADRARDPEGDRRQLLGADPDLQHTSRRPVPTSPPRTWPGGSTPCRLMGAPLFQYGKWSYNVGANGVAGDGEHTASTDARFIWWDGTARSRRSTASSAPTSRPSVASGSRSASGRRSCRRCSPAERRRNGPGRDGPGQLVVSRSSSERGLLLLERRRAAVANLPRVRA